MLKLPRLESAVCGSDDADNILQEQQSSNTFAFPHSAARNNPAERSGSTVCFARMKAV